MKLRIEETSWELFTRSLRAATTIESAGIILAEPLDGGEVLVAREMHIVPEDGYTIRKNDQLQIAPVALNRIVHGARARGLSIFTVHTHPGTTVPWFSAADDLGDGRLMPSFYVQSPGPHGSLVIAGDSGEATARVWRKGLGPEGMTLSIVGRTLHSMSAVHLTKKTEWFCRQESALGEAGQRSIRALHVGIVGLGGTGSASMMQVAHLGVGCITLVDGDLVETSNVSRVVGATVDDAGKTPKVDVASRYVASLGLGTHVEAITGNLGAGVDIGLLNSCDIVLSCVDRHSPRALLNRLAYERLIPVVDMGSVFRVDPTGRISSSAGRVVVVGPGRPCLGCWGHLDARELYIESLPEAERQEQAGEGYIDGANVAQPSVIPFNTLVAGAAVVELLRLVTGFAGSEDPPNRLSFDFGSGSVRRNRLAREAACRICGSGKERTEP